MPSAVHRTDFPYLRRVSQGKVRDIYEVGDALLIVSTDRISAYDSVLLTPVTGRGVILTQLSLFWFDLLRPICPNHLISSEAEEIADAADAPDAERDLFIDTIRDRSMLVRRAEVVPIECVARGYITGSGWKEYQASGQVCGIPLPEGLRESDQLPEPIFTPTTKAASGHDMPVTYSEVVAQIGVAQAETLRDLTLKLYAEAAQHAIARGIIIADTKFEFGRLPDGKIILIDEVLTPDSSRFWDADRYEPGGAQASYDKQYLRDWLRDAGWSGAPPDPPTLPDDVVARTIELYQNALNRLTS